MLRKFRQFLTYTSHQSFCFAKRELHALVIKEVERCRVSHPQPTHDWIAQVVGIDYCLGNSNFDDEAFLLFAIMTEPNILKVWLAK